MKNVLIIGATSAIAEATDRVFAKRSDKLYLLGRNEERLTTLAEDLKIRKNRLALRSLKQVKEKLFIQD